MDYSDWLKKVQLDANFRESLENSKTIASQVQRFSKFVIADVTDQIRRGKDIDLIIRELQSGFGIPKNHLERFSKSIQDQLKVYADFRAGSGRDLGIQISDSEFQRLSATVNFTNTIQQQTAQDVINSLEKGKNTPSIQKALASGSGVNQIENILRQGGLTVHAFTEARLALQQFNNLYSFSVSDQAGIDKFEYYGPNDAKVRPFCAGLVGLWFTKDQLTQMVNGLGYPVLIYCGGPNCRHEHLPVPVQFQQQFPEKSNVAFELSIYNQNAKRPVSVFTSPSNKETFDSAFAV
ncbi:MAG: hypothetical protein ABJI69_09070 [Balneola sp.]